MSTYNREINLDCKLWQCALNIEIKMKVTKGASPVSHSHVCVRITMELSYGWMECKQVLLQTSPRPCMGVRHSLALTKNGSFARWRSAVHMRIFKADFSRRCDQGLL